MPRVFDIPQYFRSPIISTVKAIRRERDPRRRDFSPSVLDFGPLRIRIARHFGFCFGVENAIEIAYRTIAANPDRRVFLLSEMIHNPHVNDDLRGRGVRFIMTTSGRQLVKWDELNPEDVVIVPAFGTTLEVEAELRLRGIAPYQYDTTCPFVEKVWNRTRTLGDGHYTVVVHGRPDHEETRATFSHSSSGAPTVVVRDMPEAERLSAFIVGTEPVERFDTWFQGRCSAGFDPTRHLERIGVVNQTTMLASETQAIADRLRDAMIERYGSDGLQEHFADTRDTLCYATNENQNATLALVEAGADLAVVIGGYNSSNTSHLVELCEQRMPTYFIRNAEEILSASSIRHYDLETRSQTITNGWLAIPRDRPLEIAVTSGASCPDALVDETIEALRALVPGTDSIEGALERFTALQSPAI